MMKPPKRSVTKRAAKARATQTVVPLVHIPSSADIDRVAHELYRADREKEWVAAALGARLHLWPQNFAALTERRQEDYRVAARAILTQPPGVNGSKRG